MIITEQEQKLLTILLKDKIETYGDNTTDIDRRNWENLLKKISDINTEVHAMEQEAVNDCWQQIHELQSEEWQDKYEELTNEED